VSIGGNLGYLHSAFVNIKLTDTVFFFVPLWLTRQNRFDKAIDYQTSEILKTSEVLFIIDEFGV